jgi:OPA family glycerol-3-phosphate transporter-like MFS transporter
MATEADMLSIFKPAAHKARLPTAEIDPLYRRLRWQIFIGIFFGYAAYYLVRKNFALAMPYLIEQGSPAAISALRFPVSPSPTDFRNSSWARFLTVRIRAFFCRQA